MLGYQRTTILSLLTFENIFICCGAFVIGLVLGAIVHEGIVMGITALLKLSVDSTQIPFFNISAMKKTAGFILLVLAISNGRFLFKASLMNLIRFEKKAETNLKFLLFPALLGFIMTISGYGLALDILRGSRSIWISMGVYSIGMLTAILIVVGTVFFIPSFLPYVMKKVKKINEVFIPAIK